MATRPGAHQLRMPASLGAKLLLILTAVGLLGSLAITLLLASVITPSFNQLEATSVTAHVDRTRAALGEYISKVETAVRDYGDWNSSYDYMAAPGAKFEAESFSPLAMANLDVNGMAYVGNDGHIVIARWLDLASQQDQLVMRQRLIQQIGQIDFPKALRGRNSAAFYTRLGPVVAAVGVAQVRRSDGTGTPRGYVLMARQITSAQLATLLQLKARLDLGNVSNHEIITPNDTTTTIAVPIIGPGNHGVASVRFTVSRDLSTLGQRMLILAIAGSTLLLLMVLIVLRRMIAQLVLRPLNRVEQHMKVVTASGSLGLLAEDNRRDEIGSLGRSFNSMLRQLKDLREQLEVQSFALGRSESAVAVMHNVRNGLNPISTILSRGIAEEPATDRVIIDRAIGELAREDIPAARRQKLSAFVAAAIEAEASERAERRNQLQEGREAMRHVLDIIGTQQAQAHERPPLDLCNATDLLAQNTAIARYSGETVIAFDFPDHPWPVMANRVILSQVIGNLFGNAAESIASRNTGSGRIQVSVKHDKDKIHLMIRDDGEGFGPEVGATLFQRGFSTRQHKSGGLGLHWCANSMNAMEGALRLESDGPGKGAVAILTLRAGPPEAYARTQAA